MADAPTLSGYIPHPGITLAVVSTRLELFGAHLDDPSLVPIFAGLELPVVERHPERLIVTLPNDIVIDRVTLYQKSLAVAQGPALGTVEPEASLPWPPDLPDPPPMESPAVYKTSPDPALLGKQLTITGAHFGAQAGRVLLMARANLLEGAELLNWADQQILLMLTGSYTGPATLRVETADGRQSNPATLTIQPAPPADSLVRNDAYRAECVTETNARRTTARVPTLVVHEKLMRQAQEYAELLARTGHFSHVGPDGSTLATRARAAGYAYRAIGENIARYQQTPQGAVQAWYTSDGHRRNMLSTSYKEIGVGYAAILQNNRLVPTWVQVFGTRLV